jgi:hypothetical protein
MNTAMLAGRTALLSKCIELIQTGDKEQSNGNVDQAMANYERANTVLKGIIEAERDQNAIAQPKVMLANLQSKIDALKELQARLPELDRFEAIFTIEQRVRVFKVEMSDNDVRNASTSPSSNKSSTRAAENVQRKPKTLVASGRFQMLETASQQAARRAEPNAANRAMVELVILKVDRFQFPLTTSLPCLAIKHGHYVLPTPERGVFYCLVFPSNIPLQYLVAFESLLAERCQFRALPAQQADEARAVFDPAAPKSRTVRALESVSSGVGYGTSKVASTVVATGTWIASGVALGGDAIRFARAFVALWGYFEAFLSFLFFFATDI